MFGEVSGCSRKTTIQPERQAGSISQKASIFAELSTLILFIVADFFGKQKILMYINYNYS